MNNKFQVLLISFIIVMFSSNAALCDDAFVPSTRFVVDECRSSLSSKSDFNSSYCAAFISGMASGTLIGHADAIKIFPQEDVDKLSHMIPENCLGIKKNRLSVIATHFVDAVDFVSSEYDKKLILNQAAYITLAGVLQGKFHGKYSICSIK